VTIRTKMPAFFASATADATPSLNGSAIPNTHSTHKPTLRLAGLSKWSVGKSSLEA
jgi:hypothetical protein